MNELINIQTSKGGKQVVSGRELHEFLEVKTPFTDWAKRMFEYGFEENQDYALLKNELLNNQPNPKIDYILTVDCAKEISMLQRTDKGKQARLYFIECEKRANITNYNLPATFSEALRALADKTEEQEAMQRLLEAQRPKVEFYDTVANSSDTMDMIEVAKILNCGGRNNLFKMLRDQKILMQGKQNLPYQQYMDAGYFKVLESTYNTPDGKTHINRKTVVTQIGMDFISKRLKKIEKNKTNVLVLS